jgi:hypothetical protein
MAKITQKQADMLVKKGNLTKKDVETLQSEGEIASKTRSKRRFIKTANNTWVTPQFYFQGLNKARYSKNMTTLHDEVKELISKYTVATTSKKKGS